MCQQFRCWKDVAFGRKRPRPLGSSQQQERGQRMACSNEGVSTLWNGAHANTGEDRGTRLGDPGGRKPHHPELQSWGEGEAEAGNRQALGTPAPCGSTGDTEVWQPRPVGPTHVPSMQCSAMFWPCSPVSTKPGRSCWGRQARLASPRAASVPPPARGEQACAPEPAVPPDRGRGNALGTQMTHREHRLPEERLAELSCQTKARGTHGEARGPWPEEAPHPVQALHSLLHQVAGGETPRGCWAHPAEEQDGLPA